MGIVLVSFSTAAVVGVLFATMRSGFSAMSSFANPGINSTSAAQRMSIRMLRPSAHPSCWRVSRKYRDENLPFRVVLGVCHQHADPPHPLGLLRTYRKRPRSHRTAEKSDELAPLHCAPHRHQAY